MTRALRRATLFILILLALAIAATGLLPLPNTWQAVAAILGGAPLGSAAGAVSASLLIALTGLVPSIMIVSQRAATLRRLELAPSTRRPLWIARRFARLTRAEPLAWVAGWPQGLVITALAAAAVAAAWYFAITRVWPPRGPPTRLEAGGALIALSFPLLIVERYFARLSLKALPEAAKLAGLLYVPLVVALACGALEAAAGLGIAPWLMGWLELGVTVFTAAAATERAARGLAACLAPRTTPDSAQAASGSLLARLLRPSAWKPTSIAAAVKERFGLDFSRSWAIRFAGGALLPVLLSATAFCWLISGIVSVGLNQRGQYERLGKPVEVLGSGLHLVLPWPLGAVRMVEHGVVHSVTIGDVDNSLAVAPGEFVGRADTGPVGAEDIPPPSANRLWDQPRPSEVSYIIASTSAGRQSFEMISADLRVLFRVGLDNESVLRAAYRTSDPAALVRTLAREQLAQFFATRTLTDVLGADRQAIANGLRDRLNARLDALRTGIEIVAVIVEAAQPPAGAAGAYHHVQAAQIDATTAIASERGRALATASVAARDAYEALDQAAGNSAQAVDTAKADLTGFGADDRAYRAGGRAFILERYFANLQSALGQTTLEILDDRLDGGNQSTLDLRPPSSGGDNLPTRDLRR